MICEPRWGWGARAICIGSSLGKESQKNTCSLERFFFLVDLGPGAAVGSMRAARDKHWAQLLFDSGSSSAGFFFLVDLGPGAAVGSMRMR